MMDDAHDAIYACAAAVRDELAPEIERLRAALLIGHTYAECCPTPASPDDRDQDCQACAALGQPVEDVMADYICPDTKDSCGDDPCRWCGGRQCPAAIALTGVGAWVSVAETVPEGRQSVALLNIDRWENVSGDWSRNVHACGYWIDSHGGGYWSVRGEPALCREAFTHWTALPPVAGPNVGNKR